MADQGLPTLPGFLRSRPSACGGDDEHVGPVRERDERRGEEDRRPRRDPFDLLVLVQAGLGEPGHLLVLPLPDQGGLPVQILGDNVMSGSVEKEEDVFKAWEENLGVKPQ